ncbi:MAG: HAMP domain-containing histidine kinase [Chloroflexi bacterium]|nr:HAMP domain-containing histidine kinase [Chloroflexota bacterium]
MHYVAPSSWPIRWRLTALNVGVLAATLLIVGGIFLLELDGALIGLNADYLRDQARPILNIVNRPPRGPGEGRQGGSGRSGGPAGPQTEGDRPGSDLPDFPLPRMATGFVRGMSGPDTGVRVYDADGTLVSASEVSEGVESWPQPAPELVRAMLAGSEQRAVVEQQTRRTLLLLLPLRSADGTILGGITLSRSLELTDHLESRLRTALAIGTILAVLLAGIVALRATRGALRPLDRVIRAARRIGAGRIDERLHLARRDEIGELAEAFDSMLDRLAAALIAQRRFVADAAHELRTPLTALGGMVEVLQMGADRGDATTVHRLLGTMEREIDRLGRLVGDLLTLSRLDAEQRLRMAPVELAPLVEEVATQTRLLARGQVVRVSIGAEPIVEGDADRLKQVLINLTANALSFTPPDGRIELGVGLERGLARLTVSDTGAGIQPDVLPRVMDRFVRGDPSRARATGGSGLGLAIARGIIEAHHGRIDIRSEVDRGTTVRVLLPLLAVEAPSGNGQLSPSAASGPAGILRNEAVTTLSGQRAPGAGGV